MTFEEALVFVDSVLKPGYLNQVQELVLRQSWEGRTYLEIAIDSCYDAEYIKNVGYHLWHLLSQRLGEKVTKSNLRSVLRRHSSPTPTLTPENQLNPIAPLSFALPNLEPQESRESSSIIVESQNQDNPVVSEQERFELQQTQKLSKAISTPKIPTTDKWRLATQKEWEKERAQERENKGNSQNTQSIQLDTLKITLKLMESEIARLSAEQMSSIIVLDDDTRKKKLIYKCPKAIEEHIHSLYIIQQIQKNQDWSSNENTIGIFSYCLDAANDIVEYLKSEKIEPFFTIEQINKIRKMLNEIDTKQSTGLANNIRESMKELENRALKN